MDAATPTTNKPKLTAADWLLARLARTTSSGRFLPEIDGLRTVAVLAVLFFHLDDQLGIAVTADLPSQALTGMVRRGFFGVPIFFAISAFIVALPFAQHHLNAREPVTVGRFYLRRLTRLEPPYIVNLLVLWLAGALVGAWSLGDKAGSLLTGLVYQHNQVYGAFNLINSVAWSLEVEFQFYLLAPVLTTLFAIRRAWVRRLVVVSVVIAVVLLRDMESRQVELSLIGQLEAFAAGLLVVDVFLTEWRGELPRRRVLDLLGLLGWGLLPVAMRFNEFPALRSLLCAALLWLALIGSLGGGWLRRVLGNRWVFTFGGMCYSYYLWHQWLLGGLLTLTRPLTAHWESYWGQYLAQALLLVPVVTVICALLFVWVEKPFMRRDWPQRLAAWWRRRLNAR